MFPRAFTIALATLPMLTLVKRPFEIYHQTFTHRFFTGSPSDGWEPRRVLQRRRIELLCVPSIKTFPRHSVVYTFLFLSLSLSGNQIQSASSVLGGLLTLPLPLLGLDCTPISALGAGGNNCAAQPVCCQQIVRGPLPLLSSVIYIFCRADIRQIGWLCQCLKLHSHQC